MMNGKNSMEEWIGIHSLPPFLFEMVILLKRQIFDCFV